MSSRIEKRSLRSCVIESLKQGEMIADFKNSLLTADGTHVNLKDETDFWDYKQEIDLDNPCKIAQLAKWVLGFYNANGGAIIVGVTNDFRISGIHESVILDSVRLNDKLKRYTGGTLGLFQGRISTNHHGKVVWIIFIPKRPGQPVAVANNGPEDARGGLSILKNQYYIRIHDEVKLCTSPNDYERLFSGVSFKHLSAYIYERDEPYFRLLAPHQDKFIGRIPLLQKLQEALDSRHYIISLDGVGGVGKSALAIEFLRRLYKAKKYQFIVSLSAKSRVWLEHTETRRADFSGYTEFLKEIAKVLDVPYLGVPTPDIEAAVIGFMDGLEGLLLIDNIEDIQDSLIMEFLKDKIPSPVKVLVTSRVNRDLGARTILVEEMTQEEATELFQNELERVEYHNYINEWDDVQQIIRATGRLPLAIKWAASLAGHAPSLRQVSSQLRQRDGSNREFLEFCFSTMYDELSDVARDVALLCVYLKSDWNPLTLSIALNQKKKLIEKSISELEDRGILLRAMPNREGAFSILPLTMNFLANKWHENKSLREDVSKRVADAAVSSICEGVVFDWPIEERIRVLKEKTLQLEMSGDYEQAVTIADLAMQWIKKESEAAHLRFIEGRIIYKRGDKKEGIARMQSALEQGESMIKSDELMFLAEAMLFCGDSSNVKSALEIIAANFGNVDRCDEKLLEEVCERMLEHRSYGLLRKLIANIKKKPHMYLIAKALREYLDNSELPFLIGEQIVTILKNAADSDNASNEEKIDFRDIAKVIESKFEALPNARKRG